jgi:hypothetical protein
MAVHKDCYSAIDLTQQDGLHRRETVHAYPAGQQFEKPRPRHLDAPSGGAAGGQPMLTRRVIREVDL